jgi:hypothetical protein
MIYGVRADSAIHLLGPKSVITYNPLSFCELPHHYFLFALFFFLPRYQKYQAAYIGNPTSKTASPGASKRAVGPRLMCRASAIHPPITPNMHQKGKMISGNTITRPIYFISPSRMNASGDNRQMARQKRLILSTIEK